MDRIAAGTACHVDYFFNAQITFARRCGAYWIGLIREANVERFTVNLAENRNTANAQLAAGAQDAHRAFPAIGNQDSPKHGPLMLPRDSSTRNIATERLACAQCLIV